MLNRRMPVALRIRKDSEGKGRVLMEALHQYFLRGTGENQGRFRSE
jgi:hypothetical protein